MKGWIKRKIKTVSREIFWRYCDFRRNLWNFPGRINGMFTGESRAPKKKVKQWHFRFLTKASFLETLILLSNRVVQSMVQFNIQLHLIFRDGKHKKIKKNAEKNLRTYRNLRGIFRIFALSDASLSNQTMIKRKCVRRSSDAALWKYSIFSEQQQRV